MICGRKIIVPSNIAEKQKSVYEIDYKRWRVQYKGKTFDASGAVLLNMLNSVKPKEILLAGFDGFSADVNENYFSKELRKPVVEQENKERNAFYQNYISELSETNKITFVTDSMYKYRGV